MNKEAPGDNARIVIEQIQELILSGSLKPGDRLAPERQMTELLGVGRPALREGLKALELMGVIERRQGSGNYITQSMSGNIFKSISLAYQLGGGGPEDVLSLRLALEVFSAREACKHADKQNLAGLRQIHESLLLAKSAEQGIQADRQFHLGIAQMSHNLLLTIFTDSISYLLDALYSKTVPLALAEEGSAEKLYREHGLILKAIETGDADLAQDAMLSHFDSLGRSLEREQE